MAKETKDAFWAKFRADGVEKVRANITTERYGFLTVLVTVL